MITVQRRIRSTKNKARGVFSALGSGLVGLVIGGPVGAFVTGVGCLLTLKINDEIVEIINDNFDKLKVFEEHYELITKTIQKMRISGKRDMTVTVSLPHVTCTYDITIT